MQPFCRCRWNWNNKKSKLKKECNHWTVWELRRHAVSLFHVQTWNPLTPKRTRTKVTDRERRNESQSVVQRVNYWLILRISDSDSKNRFLRRDEISMKCGMKEETKKRTDKRNSSSYTFVPFGGWFVSCVSSSRREYFAANYEVFYVRSEFSSFVNFRASPGYSISNFWENCF